jgi:hypothetical protein
MPVSRTQQIQWDGTRAPASANGILYPLDALYARAGIAGPIVKRTTAGRIPPPYHGLLVHQDEMTSTLERHFGGPLTVRVLSSFSRGRSYFRRVLLVVKSTGRPVAMGAVRLRLDVFRPTIRARILSEQVPLGRVMRDAGIMYRSRPTAFFQVTPNAEMMGVFWMPEPETMYGRQTQVTLGDARIGDIVEILPLV